MTPLDLYQKEISSGKIISDAQQLTVMQYLQTIYFSLIAEQNARESVFKIFRKKHLVKGLYLYGSVGVGKTFLMDCFFQSLPFKNKLRMHFHHFMQYIHDALKLHQGEKDPLQIIAKELSEKAIVLCFDELFVSDITDAMLLGRLFKALFLNGVSLIATSNVAPDDLYKNGLQRSQFLPAISLLKQKTEVVNIPSVIDYRLRHLQTAGVFYTPLNQDTKNKMEQTFLILAHGQIRENGLLEINNREIKYEKLANDCVWFDFNIICSVPRSQKDYLEISKQFKTVFISNIPQIQENEKDKICLFVSLVDVLYDAKVKLVISSAEPVAQIYSRGYMIMEFTRTHSRLLEMQSEDYFGG